MGINVIKKAAAVIFIENTSKTPRLLLHGLHVLNLDEQYIAGLCTLDLEGPREIMNLSKVYVLHIVCTIIILNLPARPVNTLYLDDLAILNRSCKGYFE